jgi:hypothetical protein
LIGFDFCAANYHYHLAPNAPGATPIIEHGTTGTSDWSNPDSLTAD